MNKLKIVHTMFETAHGGLKYEHLSSGGRGVTGSEQALLYLAAAQVAMGHEVTCYVPTDSPSHNFGVEIIDYKSAWPRLRKMDTADVVISWLSADSLRGLSPNKVRIHSIQINDWWINGFGYEHWVDAHVFVTKAHKDYLMTQTGNPGPHANLEIIPNGTEYSAFSSPNIRVPKRCVYASSPDRGLHWLLHIWPEIKQAHPDAELHVFYEINKWLQGAILLNSESGIRARYVLDRLEKNLLPGVFYHGAVSPKDLSEQLGKADVLLYPCDTIRFTEGFGVAIMDACAAGLVPILTDCDALNEVYSESGSIIIPRGNDREWVDRFRDEAIRLLASPEERDSRRQVVQKFAENYSWSKVAHTWQEVIYKHVADKRNLGRISLLPKTESVMTTRGPRGGKGPDCQTCGESSWVELAGGPSNDVYRPNIDRIPTKAWLGSGHLPDSDLAVENVDIVHDLTNGIPLHDDHAERLKMMDVFNFFTQSQAKEFLKECLRVLKPGGSLFLRTVDMTVVAKEICREGLTQKWLEIIYGSPGSANLIGRHLWGYSPSSLKSLLEEIGFTNITQRGYYNPHEMKIEAWKPSSSGIYQMQIPEMQ